MADTTYNSNFPYALYGGNTQSERTDQDAATLARARDYNTHDEEIKQIEEVIGTFPSGTDPTGSILWRLYQLEEDPGVGSHGLTSVYHTGYLSIDKVYLPGTGAGVSHVTGWMNKVFGAVDWDGDGYVTLADLLQALAINKEMLDDWALVTTDWPWQVPTGGGPPGTGKPGGGGGGGGGPGPGEGGGGGPVDGGWDPADPGLPIDEIWTGVGAHDQSLGLLINYDAGRHYGVRRYLDAGGSELTGIQDLSDVAFAEVWGSPPAGFNYGLAFFRKPLTTSIGDDIASMPSSSFGGLVFDPSQVDLDDADGDSIGTIDVGNKDWNTNMVAGTGSTVVEDGNPGWFLGVDYAVTTGSIEASFVVPDTGTYSIILVASSTQGNLGVNDWDIQTDYSVNRGAPVNLPGVVTPPDVAGDTCETALVGGLSLSAGDLVDITVDFLGTGAHWLVDGGKPSVHAVLIRCTSMG